MTNGNYSEKKMYVGKNHSGEKFIDSLGNNQEEIIIDSEGFGIFKANPKSVSVWVSA